MYLTQSLHRNLRQTPDAIAVIYREQQWSYRQFSERVAKFAGALRELGVGDGERVAILSLNSARYLEYTMAVPWAGGVINPVNTRWSAAEVAYALNDSGTKILLVDDHFVDLIPDIKSRSNTLETVIYVGDSVVPEGMQDYEQLVACAQPVEDALRCNDDLAGIFYTGGTTGFPKGVMLSHSNIVSSAVSVVTSGLSWASGRFLHAAPMFHIADFGMMMGIFLSGATHVVVPRFDPEEVLLTVERRQVTNTLLVPTMVQMLLESESLTKHDISSLLHIIYGASPMQLATLKLAMEKMPEVALIQAYGMTELSPLASINGPENYSAEGLKTGRACAAGLPVLLQEVKIVNEQGIEVPRGTVGEVVARGPSVMLGYWGKPEATAQAVRDGWMYTGDGGYMDDEGYIYIVDRVKDMVISGGENIYSAEVESAISQHPAVAQCAVIGIPSEQWGESVHAVIVGKPGVDLALDELRAHCRTLIAGYKCPSSMELVQQLPLSGAGKVLKVELRKPYWAQQESCIN